MNQGKILEVVGARVDLDFSGGALPDILNAVTVQRYDGSELVLEVQQHLGKTGSAPLQWIRQMDSSAVPLQPIPGGQSPCQSAMRCSGASLT